MSSQLTNLVPIFDGTNYQQWASCMQSFLMSQGQWKVTKPGSMPPKLKVSVVGEGDDAVATTTGEEEVAKWEEDCDKALGNIRLRLHHHIAQQFNDKDDPSVLWYDLRERYGAPGISQAFVEFKSAMDTVIPNGSDPSPALDKIMSHFT